MVDTHSQIDTISEEPMQPTPLTKSLVRAMDILKAVTAAPGGANPADIADQLGLPRPTVYRLLTTLGAVGMTERDAGGAWFVGPELLRLGRRADQSGTLVTRAQPTLEELVAATGETAMLAIARGPFDVEVVSQVDAPNLLSVAQWVGRPVAAHASAAGKIVLSELEPDDRTRYVKSLPLPAFTGHTISDHDQFLQELESIARRGYAETIDELEDGLSGIVAPIRGQGGRLVAIIGVYGPTPRVCGPQRDQITAAVRNAATQLTEEL
jgi:DNA-binding IclR family transcriptional regulator